MMCYHIVSENFWRMRIKILSYLVVMLMPLVAFGYDVPQEKRFPPYPDVWGFDFNYFDVVRNDSNARVNPLTYLLHGDVWYAFISQDVGDIYKDVYTLYKFFEGTTDTISGKEYFEISGKSRNIRLDHKMEMKEKYCGWFQESCMRFSNGETIGDVSFSSNCPVVNRFYRDHLEVGNAKGEQLRAYSVVAIDEEELVYEPTERWCDEGFDASQDETITTNLYIMGGVIPLEDDTFIIGGSSLVIRFDQNLKTKFKGRPVKLKDGRLFKNNFFVLPYEVVDQIEADVVYSKTEPRTAQRFYNQVLDYIFQHQDQLIKEMQK
jgi:hypothetical protein